MFGMNSGNVVTLVFFFNWKFTLYKAEQPLRGTELKENKAQEDRACRKFDYKKHTVTRCLLILDLKLLRS